MKSVWDEENRQIKESIVNNLKINAEDVKVEDSRIADIRVEIKNLSLLSKDHFEALERAIQKIVPTYKIKYFEIVSYCEKPFFEIIVWC